MMHTYYDYETFEDMLKNGIFILNLDLNSVLSAFYHHDLFDRKVTFY